MYGGQGDYTDNALIAGGRDSQAVHAANDETDAIVISDCEYVKDIFAPVIASGSSSFASQTVPCNPGLQAFAPSISQLAINFTEYEILQLVYELRPVISESNVNNGLTGIAMMVYNYNPNDDPYDNKEDVMQAHGSVSGKITDMLRCGVECDPTKTNRTKFFIRGGPVPYGRDNDEYDMGVLTIATNNIPAAFSNQQLYEMWCSYTIRLRKRKPGALRLLNQQRDLFVCSGDVAFGSLFSSQFVGGVNGVCASQQNNIGGSVSSTVAQTLVYTLPADFNGFLTLGLYLEGTGIAGTGGLNVTYTGNVVAVSDMYAAGTAGDAPANQFNQGSATGFYIELHVKVRSATGGVNNAISVNPVYTAGTFTQWQLDVRELTTAHWQSRSVNRPLLINVTDNAVVTP